MSPSEELKLKISLLPDSPGVYRYYNKDGVVIYVGKAKNLKRRVSSYFNRVHTVARTNMLVRNIADLQYTVVRTEEDALHLENSIIKEYQPYYNVLLKDDKSYPWICVTAEDYPRVFVTRNKPIKGAKVFGPYAHSNMARTVIDVIRKIYPLRTCNHAIDSTTIARGKTSLCLQYHIHNCEGCCRGLVSVQKYGEYIDGIKKILNGDTRELTQHLVAEMTRLAGELRFEEAQALKEKYLLIEKYRAKSEVVNQQLHNVDVFTLLRDDDSAYVNFMHVRNGSIVKTLTLEYKIKLDEPDEEVMSIAIDELRHRFDLELKDVLVSVCPDAEFKDVNFVIPQRGDKRKLLELSLQNAKQYKMDKLKRMEKLNPDQRVMRTLTTMQRDFRLNELPRHIECFDNSNIQGTNPVASCVVFRNAKPSKKDYRHFNIKTVEGPDDFASMKEVLTRRYTRLMEEGEELPQLVVVDGGKGQLSAAVEAFDEIGIRGRVALVGIAKRLEEIYFPGDSIPLYIDKNSESLRVVQHLRDEAHRFGITHHRNRRSRSQLSTIFDGVKGLGPKTHEALIKHFKSMKKVKQAGVDEVAQVIGRKKAELVFNLFKTNNLEINNSNENSDTEGATGIGND
ncbi:MAG: excinuclease ABC subunit UvrC [Muribaculaceae bacterium]